MQAGQPSVTAQRVAAQRLTFDRVPAPYGDPAADDTLARDVAAAVSGEPGRMSDYLRARTRFFDRAVTGALARGCPQAVIGAAGYDGRALRYAKPGVRWFEVDHPVTQQDKRARLQRLGIEAGHIGFVAADFAVDPVADRQPGAEHGRVGQRRNGHGREGVLHGLRGTGCRGGRDGRAVDDHDAHPPHRAQQRLPGHRDADRWLERHRHPGKASPQRARSRRQPW